MFKRFDNESAVSPIVATLVLIVVAVVGAVAVGSMMGAFSGEVAETTNTGDVAGASSTEILVAGSTTVQPASELLAKAYMDEHPGVRITVQGGGSGAGVSSCGMGIVDIGAASRTIKAEELERFPDLETYIVGGSAVVWVASDEFVGTAITKADLAAAYADLDASGVTVAVHGSIPAGTALLQRSETSGTEETAAEFVTDKASKSFDNTNALGQIGNAGIKYTVEGASVGTIGFIDYGYAQDLDATKIHALDIDTMTPSTSNIKKAVKAMIGGASSSTDYPIGLCRGLYYITNGQPSPIVKNYIQFAQSPAGSALVDEAGMFGNAALA